MILGPIAIFIVWAMGGYVIYSMRHLKHPTVSRLAASAKKTYLIFAVCMSMNGILIYIFMLNWFIAQLALPTIFTVLVTLVIILQIVTAWAPDTIGWKHRIHHFTAWSEAWLLLPIAVLIAASPNISILAQILCILLILFMLVLTLRTYKLHDKPEFKYSQAAYIMAFHTIVLIATFSRLLR